MKHAHLLKTAPVGVVIFIVEGMISVQTRIAVIGIIVEQTDEVSELNQLLHIYRDYIIGRMGIPYRQRGVNIISVAVDAPQDVISALTGKIGRLTGISTKTAYSKVVSD